MSGSIFPYGRQQMLTKTFLTGSTPCWVALVRIVPPPGANGSTLQEPSSSYGYTRVAYPLSSTNWALTSTNDTITNTTEVTFPTVVTAEWGWIGGWALVNSVFGGDVIAASTLAAGKTIIVGDTPRFSAGKLLVGIRG